MPALKSKKPLMIEELFTMAAINVVQGRFFSSLCTAAPVLKKPFFFLGKGRLYTG